MKICTTNNNISVVLSTIKIDTIDDNTNNLKDSNFKFVARHIEY